MVILLFTHYFQWGTEIPCALQTPHMQQLMKKAARALRSPHAILIEGEASTGKKTLGRILHANGSRKNKPFIEVDCAFSPNSICEILFGSLQHSSKKTPPCKIASANGGSIFLENIDALPLNAQKKLLRLVEIGELEQGGRIRRFDVRIIASTCVDLLEKVRTGEFLEDLFYRLNVMILSVPPLRARKEDIPVISHDLLEHYAHQNGRDICTIDTDALSVLQQHEWPENLEELKTVIFAAAHHCQTKQITASDIVRAAFFDGAFTRHYSSTHHHSSRDSNQPELTTVDLFDPMGELRPLIDLEEEIIRFALDHYNSRISEVSRRLGIGRSTLYRKMKEHGLEEATQSAS